MITMRVKKNYMVITFSSTSKAMAMEKFCGEHGLSGRLIPVPQEISAGCGLAWRVAAEEFGQLADCRLQWTEWAEQVVELTM